MEVAGALLHELAASPRPAGGSAEASARERCAEWLNSLGMEVREEHFAYSAFPGRWATPLCGAGLIGTFLVAGHVGSGGSGVHALAVLISGVALVAGAGWWFARFGVLNMPFDRREGVNLTAVRHVADMADDDTPWFMAHLDSKSQPVPIAVRAAGIVSTSLVTLLAAAYALAQCVDLVSGSLWLALTGAGVLSALPVVASTVGSRSPGALDNATGVTAVLLAAAALPREAPCRVCITSAEELGLAGARAWVESRAGQMPQPVWNVDTLDDAGSTQAMWSRRLPHEIVSRLRRAAEGGGHDLRVRRALPGILTDAIAAADADWPAVTISRGSARTLLRVHTPGDDTEQLTGEGAALVARLLAGATSGPDRSRR